MKLPKPKITLAEMIRELDAVNANLFQLKQFSKMICELIDKGEPVEKMKHVKDIFRPMEAIENLEQL